MKKLVIVIAIAIIAVCSMTACTGMEDVVTEDVRHVLAYEATYELNKDDMDEDKLDEYMINYVIDNDIHYNGEFIEELKRVEEGYHFYLINNDNSVWRYEIVNNHLISTYERGI